jgi:hypothetical protein
VLSDEQRILREIDSALASRPGTRPQLATPRSIVATHIEWLVKLRGADRQQSSPATTGTQPTSSPTGTASAGPVLPDREAAVRLVSNVCSRAVERRLRECVSAEAGPLAQFLASISASYVVLVKGLRAG